MFGAECGEFARNFSVWLHRRESDLSVRRAENEPGESVVVALGNRVELVVVTTCTRDGESKKRLRQNIHLVVHALALVLQNVHGIVNLLAKECPTGGEHGFICSAGIEPWGDDVAGDVFRDKAIVGQVGIEGASEVVAVPPRIRDDEVVLVTTRFRVADHVHPVSRPSFAKVW